MRENKLNFKKNKIVNQENCIVVSFEENIDIQLYPFLLHHSFGLVNVFITQPLTNIGAYCSFSKKNYFTLLMNGCINKPKCFSTAWKHITMKSLSL